MKLQRKTLSLLLALSTLFCCFTNLSVKAADIDVSNLTYIVDNMTFYKGNVGGTQIDSLSKATFVGVDVTEQTAISESNTVIIAAYSSDGTFISKNSVTKSFTYEKTETVKLALEIPEGKTVSEIRAFVWQSFDSMTPLSNILSSNNNMIIVPRYDYDENTRFAVVTEAGFTDEGDVYAIDAMYQGETILPVSKDIDTAKLEALNPSDVIYFKMNAKYQITDFDVIFSFGGNVPTQATLATNSLVANNTNYENLNGITIYGKSGTDGFSDKFTTDWNASQFNSIKYIYGPVLERGENYIVFGKTDANNKTNTYSNTKEFYVPNDVNVYTYNYAMNKRLRFDYSMLIRNIFPTFIPIPNDTIDWNDEMNRESVTFAFAVVVDNEVVDILAFFYD